MRVGEIALADVDADGKVVMLFKRYGDSIRIYQYNQGQCMLKAELLQSPNWRGFGRSAAEASLQRSGPGPSSSSSQRDTSVFPVVKTTFQHYDILDYNDDSYPDIAVCGMGGVQIISNGAGKESGPAGLVGDVSGYGPHLTVCHIDHNGKEDVVVRASDEIIAVGVDNNGVLERSFTANNGIGGQDPTRPRAPQRGFTWSPTGRLQGVLLELHFPAKMADGRPMPTRGSPCDGARFSGIFVI